jgi:uncharacterized protein with GYD domain
MPTYIMLSHLTDEGRKTLQERPERLREVNKEVEAMGAKILAQYAGLGGFDFVNVIEAPGNDAMMRISMELGSRGTIRIETMAALNMGGLVDTLQKKSRE